MAVLLASLLPLHIFTSPFLTLPILRLLHLPIVLRPLRATVAALRFLVLSSLALRSHLAAIATPWFLIPPVVRARRLLPILRPRIALSVVSVIVLADRRCHCS